MTKKLLSTIHSTRKLGLCTLMFILMTYPWQYAIWSGLMGLV